MTGLPAPSTIKGLFCPHPPLPVPGPPGPFLSALPRLIYTPATGFITASTLSLGHIMIYRPLPRTLTPFLPPLAVTLKPDTFLIIFSAPIGFINTIIAGVHRFGSRRVNERGGGSQNTCGQTDHWAVGQTRDTRLHAVVSLGRPRETGAVSLLGGRRQSDPDPATLPCWQEMKHRGSFLRPRS